MAAALLWKKRFSRYVLVDMIVTDDTWYVVRNTQHNGFSQAQSLHLLTRKNWLI